MSTFFHDIKYAVRLLRKQPGFTIVAVLILALGIGANTALFSLIQGVLLKPLPFASSERLVVMRQNIMHDHKHVMTTGVSYLDYQDWSQDNQIFEDMAGYSQSEFSLVTTESAIRLSAGAVFSRFFSTLEVSPAVGRLIQEKDERPGAAPVVVLSHALWKRQFGGQEDVVGRTIRNSDTAYTVIGVLPRTFDFPPLDNTELWVPLIPEDEDRTNRTHAAFDLVGRLRPGLTMTEAQQQINELEDRITEAALSDKQAQEKTVVCTALHDFVVGGVRRTLWILYGIVGFILLIACANVGNLCLVRAWARDREMSVRSALGAGRGRLLRQILIETTLLGLLGGVVGLLVGYWSVAVLRIWVADMVPRMHAVYIDSQVFFYTLGISLLVGVCLGLAPYIRLRSTVLVNALKERSTASKQKFRLSQALVTGQIALALVLLMGTGLMVRSLMRIMQVNTGFNPACVTTFNFILPPDRYANDTQRMHFCSTLLERLEQAPDVLSCALDTGLPFLGGCGAGPVQVPGNPKPEGQPPMVVYHSISPDYFKTLQIPLSRGEVWQAHAGKSAFEGAVINQALADLYWPKEDPIGRPIEASGQHFRVMGVCANAKQWNLKNNRQNIQLFVPYPALSFETELIKFAVRTSSNQKAVIGHIRSVLKDIDPKIPLHDVQTLSTRMNRTIRQERFATAFLTLFTGIALTLTIVGIYGIVSFALHQRLQEIGIRMALGATRRHITGMVLKKELLLAVIGSLLGIVGAMGLTRFLAGYLYEISPFDPVTFIAVPFLIIMVTLLTSFFPIWRAARNDPIEALRYE